MTLDDLNTLRRIVTETYEAARKKAKLYGRDRVNDLSHAKDLLDEIAHEFREQDEREVELRNAYVGQIASGWMATAFNASNNEGTRQETARRCVEIADALIRASKEPR